MSRYLWAFIGCGKSTHKNVSSVLETAGKLGTEISS